jgi:chromodomain-helicase-DNA-binding protein 4
MPNEPGYSAFEAAFERFIYSRHVTVPILNKKQIKEMDDRPKDGFRRNHSLKDDEQPTLGQNSNLKLMPFQVFFSLATFPFS